MGSIAIIPARGGSKRIPRKNIKDFLGKPVIAYSIEAALSSAVFDEVMVSTDDEEIAGISKRLGASVPFYRSSKLSSDTAMTAQVLVEVLNGYLSKGRYFGHACCLYPCAPFVSPARINEAMALVARSGADSVVPVVRFSYPPQRCLVLRGGKVSMLHPENYDARSQDFEPLYHDAGQFVCFKVASLMTQQRLFCEHSLPIILPESEVQDIDTEEDWYLAEIKYRSLMQAAASSSCKGSSGDITKA